MRVPGYVMEVEFLKGTAHPNIAPFTTIFSYGEDLGDCPNQHTCRRGPICGLNFSA